MRTGKQLAEILSGSLRQRTANSISNEALNNFAPLLVGAGGAALIWFAIRQRSSDFSRPVVEFYREEYIASAARAASHEVELHSLFHGLQTGGVRSILLKGWSVGRLYAETGLRPPGDIDLWIDPEQRQEADETIGKLKIRQAIDLEHDQLSRFEDRSFADFYACCDTAYLGSTPVKVLRREDQIRNLCLHFLKHGGWRPIWLCDIAVLLQSQDAAFDWRSCLGSSLRRARWIGCTIALAHDLLGVRIPDGAPYSVTSSPPEWFTRTVLKEWSNPQAPKTTELGILLSGLKFCPWRLKSVMRGRWRNPIQATVDCEAAFDAIPRLPFQLWDAASRARRFLRNLRTGPNATANPESSPWLSCRNDYKAGPSLVTASVCGKKQ